VTGLQGISKTFGADLSNNFKLRSLGQYDCFEISQMTFAVAHGIRIMRCAGWR
jgi:hypothetical protein